MQIDGKSLETFGAKLSSFRCNGTAIKNNYYIPPQGTTPIYIGSENQGKVISLRVILTGNDADTNYQAYSRLKLALNRCTLHPANSIFFYDVIMTDDSISAFFKKTPKEAEFTFTGVQYTAPQSVTMSSTSLTVTNTGTADTPFVMTIKPSAPSTLLGHVGNTNIAINGMIAGNTYILDSEKGKFTENGKNSIDKYVGVIFPVLKPGANYVSFALISNMDIKITWKPRWI